MTRQPDNDLCREEFEKWFGQNSPLKRNGDEYQWVETQNSWYAWQAAWQTRPQPVGGGEVDEKPLREYLREENDLLAFKMQCNAMKGKTFTLEEAREICEKRERQLNALDAPKAENAVAADQQRAEDIYGLHSKIDMDIEDEIGRELSLEESRIVGLAIRKALKQ